MTSRPKLVFYVFVGIIYSVITRVGPLVLYCVDTSYNRGNCGSPADLLFPELSCRVRLE